MLALIPVFYDAYQNMHYSYFYLSAKEGVSENVELYRGKPTAWDIFHLKRYIAETDYQRSQIEPSTLFNKRITNDFNQMNEELIDTLKPIEKLRAYWKSGQTTKALSTIERSIEQYPERTQDIIGVLSEFRSLETMEKLRELLRNPALVDMHRTIVDVMAFFPHPTITHILLSELNSGKFYPPKVRRTYGRSFRKYQSYRLCRCGYEYRHQVLFDCITQRSSAQAIDRGRKGGKVDRCTDVDAVRRAKRR